MTFSASLLREKFVIRDASSGNLDGALTAASNRIAVHLHDGSGRLSETFIVRAHTMHTCVRMAAKILKTFQDYGPIMARAEAFDFNAAWHDITDDYERRFNEKLWCVVYNAGRPIFRSNDYHAFFDVIENCDVKNTSGNYETSVFLAEEIFAQKGKNITVDYSAHTGMVLDIKQNRARCSMILRSPIRRNNFSYTAELKHGGASGLNIPQCLTVAAAYLEGIHLAFLVGRVNENLRLEKIAKYGAETKNADAARSRITLLNAGIENFEARYDVKYRPERPEFPHIVVEAEKYTHACHDLEQLKNNPDSFIK